MRPRRSQTRKLQLRIIKGPSTRLDPVMPCPMHGSKSFTTSSKILVLNLVAGCQGKTAARCGPAFFRPAIPTGVRSHQIRHNSKKPLAPESWFFFVVKDICKLYYSELDRTVILFNGRANRRDACGASVLSAGLDPTSSHLRQLRGERCW